MKMDGKGHRDAGVANAGEPPEAPAAVGRDAGLRPSRDNKSAGGRKGGSASAADPSEESGWDSFVSNVKTIVGAILIAVLIRIVLVEVFEIEGPSMEPTLLDGDRIVVAKYPFGLFLPFDNEAVLTWGAPDRGDVVIVQSPLDEEAIVKRVIGLEGDTVEVRDSVVYRNGQPLGAKDLGPCAVAEQRDIDPYCHVYEEKIDGERHKTSSSNLRRDRNIPATLVPKGHVFVMGDHRDHSNDSTNPALGPVPISRIKGRALFVYLSWSAKDEWIRSDRVGRSVD